MFNRIPARVILWLMLFSGLAIMNMLFFNMHIAMTDIVDEFNMRDDLIYIPDEYPNETTFPWNEGQQKMILGLSYCAIPLGNMMSALASPIAGTKLLFGYSMVIMTVINFATPYLAMYETLTPLLMTRTAIGFFYGIAFPSVFAIAPYWVPKRERGTFLSVVSGTAFGDFLLFALGSILLNFKGWAMIFYVPAVLGTVWTLAWIQLMFNRPEQHPRISEEEKKYIVDLTNIGNRTTDRSLRASMPFKKVLCSSDVWINIVTQFGCMWIYLTHVIFGPIATFLEYVHDENITKISLPVTLPFFFRFAVMLAFGRITDIIVNKGWVRVTELRKFFVFLANIVPAFAFIGQVVFKDDFTFQVILIVIAKVCTGLNLHGAMGGLLDISPNFAGPIQGLACAIYALGGSLMPLLIEPFEAIEGANQPWRHLYIVGSFVGINTGVLFILFWEAEEPKEWDRVGTAPVEIEMRELGNNSRQRESSNNRPRESSNNRPRDFGNNSRPRELRHMTRPEVVENYYKLFPRVAPKRNNAQRPEDNFLAVSVTIRDNHFSVSPRVAPRVAPRVSPL